MIAKATAALVLAAVACASGAPRKVSGADGSSWWAIACQNDMGTCLERARQRCPGGYQIQGEHDARPAELEPGAPGAAIPTVHTKMAPAFAGELFVRCNDAP